MIKLLLLIAAILLLMRAFRWSPGGSRSGSGDSLEPPQPADGKDNVEDAVYKDL